MQSKENIFAVILHINNAVTSVDDRAAQVAPVSDYLDAGNRARFEEAQQLPAVKRFSVRQTDRQTPNLGVLTSTPPKFAWRPSIGISKRIIETTCTAKAGRNRNLGHGQGRLVDQVLREMQTLSVCDRQRTRTQVLREQPPQMTTGNAKTFGKIFNRTIIQRAVGNQFQAAFYGR